MTNTEAEKNESVELPIDLDTLSENYQKHLEETGVIPGTCDVYFMKDI